LKVETLYAQRHSFKKVETVARKQICFEVTKWNQRISAHKWNWLYSITLMKQKVRKERFQIGT